MSNTPWWDRAADNSVEQQVWLYQMLVDSGVPMNDLQALNIRDMNSGGEAMYASAASNRSGVDFANSVLGNDVVVHHTSGIQEPSIRINHRLNPWIVQFRNNDDGSVTYTMESGADITSNNQQINNTARASEWMQEQFRAQMDEMVNAQINQVRDNILYGNNWFSNADEMVFYDYLEQEVDNPFFVFLVWMDI